MEICEGPINGLTPLMGPLRKVAKGNCRHFISFISIKKNNDPWSETVRFAILRHYCRVHTRMFSPLTSPLLIFSFSFTFNKRKGELKREDKGELKGEKLFHGENKFR